MSLTAKELEGLLSGETRAIIKKLLADRKPAGEMNITDIEQLVLRAGEQFEVMLTEALIEAEEAERKGEGPSCPECNGKMRHRGYRERKLVTQTGEVSVRRRYYRCPDCGRGIFPPLDRQLGLIESVYSPGMAKDMVWLGGLVPYDQAVQVLERIGHRSVPRTSIWRENQTHGERMKTYLEREQGRVKPERVVLPPPGQDHERPIGISMDGGMVNINGEGWKEIKVGAVFDVDKREEEDPITGKWVAQAIGVNVEYAAVLGSVEDFAPALWRLAVEREVPQAAKTSVTADGAGWIWNVAADYFPDSV